MEFIFCVDNNYGLKFAGRRQSRDIEIYKLLQNLNEIKKIYVKSESAPLFPNPDKLIITENIPENSHNGEVFFCETPLPPELMQKAESIRLYKWNRDYPADEYFNTECLIGKTLVSTREFEGNSHKIITEEIYK